MKLPFIVFSILTLGVLITIHAQTNPSERPNVLVVDGQTGATYAMTKCDERGNFAFVGIRPGEYVLKLEFEHAMIDNDDQKDLASKVNDLITGGLDVANGNAIMKVNNHLFLLDMDMKETSKRKFLPKYDFEKNNKYYVLSFSMAYLDEISTLRGSLKKTDTRKYRRASSSASMVVYPQ